MQLFSVIRRISEANRSAQRQMERQLNSLTKPLGSLGDVEDLAIQLAGMTGSTELTIDPAMVLLLAADHGVTAEGVSAFPADVTQQMVQNFLSQGAAINVLSRASLARVQVIDMGINADLSIPGLISRKIRMGTSNMTKGPAMSYDEAIRAIETGIEIAHDAVTQGAKLLALGEMGIGNTTASSAILAVLGQIPVEDVVGVGTGIRDNVRERKIFVIEKAIAVNQPNAFDPIDILSKVGGFEIAGLTGIVLEAAASRVPVLVDGFITAVAALIATKLAPLSAQYLIGSHESVEPGHKIVNRLLGIRPLLRLHLRLGEGSGAALALPILRTATLIPKEMSTFESAQISGALDGSVQGASAEPQSVSSVPPVPKRHEFQSFYKEGVYKAIYERRDIRSFLKHPIEEEKLRRILDAAHHAPSVGFMQPWNFILVQSDSIKQQLHDMVSKEVQIAGNYFEGHRAELYPKLKVQGIVEAPITLCVTNDPTRDGTHVLGRNTIPETDVYSVVCAIENLWLAARAEGLGVGWVSFYKKEDVRQLLGIPAHIDPVALLSIGYTAAFQNKPILESVGWGRRQSLEDLLFSDAWGMPFTFQRKIGAAE
ncbi:nicotinate-nucleotide--dimethylbenzimidazole phosphoribosyltransferase [Alicyclobacillus mengziensis]|uniref:nicotinate-nucleotide--dimethylbenzimidazole phosphoribosyltransferase n=1 Tax=Alicyclobacillus mengziensis TaxID=2931921 RepID=UPI002010DE13|nr:nicotinate-nucleotide--dimethylbenzimidazole phosphoribosyltransferase [Alicyclobacillus mengziensis]